MVRGMAVVVSIDGADGSGKTTFIKKFISCISKNNVLNIDKEVLPIWKKLYSNDMSHDVRALFYYALMKKKNDMFSSHHDDKKLYILERYGHTTLAFNKAAAKQEPKVESKPRLNQEDMDVFMERAVADLEELASSGESFESYIDREFLNILSHDILRYDYYSESNVLSKPDHYVFMHASNETLFDRISKRKVTDPHEKKEFLFVYNDCLKELYNKNSERVVFIDTDKVEKQDALKHALKQRDLFSKA